MCDKIVDNHNYIELNDNYLEDCNFTLSYQFETTNWISFHDYFPDYAFRLRNNKLLSFHNNSLYLHNSNKRGVFYDGILYPSYITPTFVPYLKEKEQHIYAMCVESIEWQADLYDNTNKRLLNKTFSKASLHNSYQSSIEKTLIVYDDTCKQVEQSEQWNVRRAKNLWYFNRFRDNIINPVFKSLNEKYCNCNEIVQNVNDVNCKDVNTKHRGRFIDDFLITKLEYNNIENLELCFNELLYNVTVTKR
jgi:hypothetical protein